MESQYGESGTERIRKLRKKAKKILENLDRKFELEKKRSIKNQIKVEGVPRKKLKVKTRIPITISPEVKKKLRRKKRK